MKLFNLVLDSYYYPSSWTTGIIVPIFKSGNTSDPSTYLEITLSNCIGKVFNKMLNNRLRQYLTDNNNISDKQIMVNLKDVQTFLKIRQQGQCIKLCQILEFCITQI